MKKLKRKEIEQIARLQAPSDEMESPAYPNFTDTDIYVNGFADGIEHLMKIAESSDFHYSLTSMIRK